MLTKQMTFNKPWQILIMVASIVLLQAQSGNGYRFNKVQPNSIREFFSLECEGDFISKRETFSVLRNICEECFNLYKNTDFYDDCRSNCFKNTSFLKCVSGLQMDHKRGYFEEKIKHVAQ
uniref:ITP-like preproprotein n=1 Tax=Euphausia superba TaxID=6819 RepID=A0A1W5LU41_EUPSU|nr:ITP-like preproprotein [Euphausia superba]